MVAAVGGLTGQRIADAALTAAGDESCRLRHRGGKVAETILEQ